MTVLDRLRQLLRSSGGFVAGAASATAVFAMSPALSALDPLAEREVIERAERVRPGAETRKAMLAATPAARPLATGSLALQRNRQLPFAAGPAGAAAPFLLPDATSRWGDTALRCLTQAVYYEAGFEPMAGRRAVAQVVLNRMRHKAFPKSVCGVVYQGHTRP
ncbi:MAG: cell wall hydrolase, partial [Cypionkella sp.]